MSCCPANRPATKPISQKIRDAVVDKDFYFFWRYRTNDGYNVYGGRSFEKYKEAGTGRLSPIARCCSARCKCWT